MTTATEQLTKVEDHIIETLTSLQRPVVDAVKSLAEKAEGYVPEVPGNDTRPGIDRLVLSQFTFAEKLLANQKDFAGALLDAIRPVSTKVAAEVAAEPAPATA